MPRFSSIRAASVFLVIGCTLALLACRVAYLQTYGREKTIQRVERQQHQNETLHERRGSIFDCSGMLMAGTVQSQTLFVDPKFMHDCFQEEGRSLVELDQAIEKLAALIDQDPFELSKLLGDRWESRYIRVAERLDESVVKAITELDLPGVGFTPTDERWYPMGSIAAHVLGGVRKDNVGLEGVELKYEKLLRGKDGLKRTLKDARRRPIAVAAEDYIPPQNGQHLILTIDANIQMIAEQELAARCEMFKAQRGEVVVMDPKTGDILAMANWPTFHPQNLEDSKPETRRNRVLTDPYEPGSTLKPFVTAPAFAANITRPSEVWPINGPRYKSSLRSKLIEDVHPYAQLATWDVLVKSSNIGMTMLAERMGKPRVYRALASWQFGKATGIGLPGEDPGRLKPLEKWGTSDVVSAAQGYSVMVTPLQLTRAFCAFANGGRLVTPHIVRGVLDEHGQVVERTKHEALEMMPEAIDPITAATMKRILCDVPVRGTAKSARSKTWNIFGKTGTAHISQGRGGYSSSKYTSSFVGGAPAENPRIVVAMIIHEPDKAHALSQGLMYYGGSVAAPGASKLIERTLAYLQVPKSPDLPVPPPQIANVLYDFHANVYANRLASSLD